MLIYHYSRFDSTLILNLVPKKIRSIIQLKFRFDSSHNMISKVFYLFVFLGSCLVGLFILWGLLVGFWLVCYFGVILVP